MAMVISSVLESECIKFCKKGFVIVRSNRASVNAGVLGSGIAVVIGGSVATAVGTSEFIRGFGVGIILVGAILLGLAVAKKV